MQAGGPALASLQQMGKFSGHWILSLVWQSLCLRHRGGGGGGRHSRLPVVGLLHLHVLGPAYMAAALAAAAGAVVADDCWRRGIRQDAIEANVLAEDPVSRLR
mmetsp:Transcript_34055/g.86164  ORF Transcript_34055/g.86164 Transcript_34055/m.86164 type:complete len:103 (+) Transcript_34055:89-397(+)